MEADFETNALELAIQVQSTLASRFDLEEVKTLCFRLGVEFDNLRGEGLEGKTRELTAYFRRRQRMTQLIRAIKEYRPDIDL